MTTITEKHATQTTMQATTQATTQPGVPPFSAPLHLPLANDYWYQGIRSWDRCRYLAVKHMVPILTANGAKGNGDSAFTATQPSGDPPHFSPEYPAFLRKEIFRKDHDADPGNNPFPVDGGDLACIFSGYGEDGGNNGITYVAIQNERDRLTVMGGMGRGRVKSESARG